jgi:hypothetical protein
MQSLHQVLHSGPIVRGALVKDQSRVCCKGRHQGTTPQMLLRGPERSLQWFFTLNLLDICKTVPPLYWDHYEKSLQESQLMCTSVTMTLYSILHRRDYLPVPSKNRPRRQVNGIIVSACANRNLAFSTNVLDSVVIKKALNISQSCSLQKKFSKSLIR